MKGNQQEECGVRVELKYCEHCGALWVREGGSGVYCEKCQSKVADLPMPKKKPRPARLPMRGHTTVDDFGVGIPEEVPDLEAAGGVA
jgi:hypothetical protein